MSKVTRLEHMLRLAEHESTGEHEATTALAGARGIAKGLDEPERTRWMRRVQEAEQTLYLRLNPGAALEGVAAATAGMAGGLRQMQEAVDHLINAQGFVFHPGGGATFSGARAHGVWFDEAAFFAAPRPRTMTYSTNLDPETIRLMFGLDPED